MLRVLLFAFLAGLGLVAGCGPSFQALYEGDTRFEHCYAIDDTPDAPLERKARCWHDWVKNYTYGQTRDRVEYANMRYQALTRVHAAPTDEAMMGAAPGGEDDIRSVAAPAPTSAFAPPPKTMDADGGTTQKTPGMDSVPMAQMPPPEAGHVVPTTSELHTPKSDCTDRCTGDWQDCKNRCGSTTHQDAGVECVGCDRGYGKCVKACF